MAINSQLLNDVERDLLDGRQLSDVLRRCLLLAEEANSTELRDWAICELRGYNAESAILPPYRRIQAPALHDGTRGGQPFARERVDRLTLSEAAHDALSDHLDLHQGIAEIEAMAQAGHGRFDVIFAASDTETIAHSIDDASGNPWQRTSLVYFAVPIPSLEAILDNVRTTLVTLLAELRASAGGTRQTPTAEEAQNAVNIVLSGKARLSYNNALASGNSTAAATAGSEPPTDPAWWTLGRKIGAFVVGCAVILTLVVAYLAWIHPQ